MNGDYYKEAVVDKSNSCLLMQTVYTPDGKLYAKYFGYYEGTRLIGELDVFYDENGRVKREDIYNNGVVYPGYPDTSVVYTYDENTISASTYKWPTIEDGELVSSEYDTIINIVKTTTNEDGTKICILHNMRRHT